MNPETEEKTYMIFRADDAPDRSLTIPMFHYIPITAVRGTSPDDAVQQVAQATRRPGEYVAIECFPVSLNLTSHRLVERDRPTLEEG